MAKRPHLGICCSLLGRSASKVSVVGSSFKGQTSACDGLAHRALQKHAHVQAPRSQQPNLGSRICYEISRAQTHCSFCGAAVGGGSRQISRTMLLFTSFSEHREEMLHLSVLQRSSKAKSRSAGNAPAKSLE